MSSAKKLICVLKCCSAYFGREEVVSVLIKNSEIQLSLSLSRFVDIFSEASVKFTIASIWMFVVVRSSERLKIESFRRTEKTTTTTKKEKKKRGREIVNSPWFFPLWLCLCVCVFYILRSDHRGIHVQWVNIYNVLITLKYI